MTVLACAPLLAGLSCWALALSDINLQGLGDYGLLPALPVTWYVGFALLIVGAVGAMTGPRPRGWLIGAYVAAVAIVLSATVAAVAPVPSRGWTYKHIGVTRFLGLHGQVDPSLGFYHRWPGFFALNAALAHLAGVADPMRYAGWAEPFFTLVETTLVAACARAIARGVRLAGAAALIFLLANWVGQNYYAPQAFAYMLALAFMFVLLRHAIAAGHEPARRTVALIARVLRARAQEPLPAAGERWPTAATIAVLLGLDAVIVASHELTPYGLLLQVGILTLIGLLSPRWLLIPMVAITLGYLLPNLDFVRQHVGLVSSFDPFANAHPHSVAGAAPQAGKQLADLAGTVLYALTVIGAAVAAARLARVGLGRRALPVAVLAAGPVGLLFGQNYGGEAILRVALFTVPWCALLIAGGLATVRSARARFGCSFVLIAVLAALTLPASLGAEELQVVTAREVQASAHLDRYAQPGSKAMFVGLGFPSHYGPTYDRLAPGFHLFDDARFRHRDLGAGDVPAIAELMRARATYGYVVFSRAQREYVDVLGLAPRGAVDHLRAAIARSPYFRAWYGNSDAQIYALHPRRRGHQRERQH
jgi:hypothetical protein